MENITITESEYEMLKNKIALLEKERMEGEFDYHDGGKVNCHPQYIQGYNDGCKKFSEIRSLAEIKEAIDTITTNSHLNYGYQEDVVNVLKWVLKGEPFDGLSDE